MVQCPYCQIVTRKKSCLCDVEAKELSTPITWDVLAQITQNTSFYIERKPVLISVNGVLHMVKGISDDLTLHTIELNEVK